jgi:hypothetical protein
MFKVQGYWMQKSHQSDFPKIIFIAGYGRSGSTVLDIVLGNHKDIVSLGEVANIFQSKAESKQCSCGKICEDCPVWERILDLARDFNPEIGEATYGILDSVESIRSVLKSFVGSSTPDRSKDGFRIRYCDQMKNLFMAIQSETNASTVVDSSKTAWRTIGRPQGLSEICGFNVKVIHLIRDGRAVMWSTMQGSDPDIEHNRSKRSSLRGYEKVLNWAIVNLLTTLLLRRLPGNTVMRMHYEDFVEQPERELERIGSFINVDLSELQDRVRQEAGFKVGHLVRGNRIARQKKEITINSDFSWKQELGFHDHLFYWLFLWPAALYFRRNKRNS